MNNQRPLVRLSGRDLLILGVEGNFIVAADYKLKRVVRYDVVTGSYMMAPECTTNLEVTWSNGLPPREIVIDRSWETPEIRAAEQARKQAALDEQRSRRMDNQRALRQSSTARRIADQSKLTNPNANSSVSRNMVSGNSGYDSPERGYRNAELYDFDEPEFG